MSIKNKVREDHRYQAKMKIPYTQLTSSERGILTKEFAFLMSIVLSKKEAISQASACVWYDRKKEQLKWKNIVYSY